MSVSNGIISDTNVTVEDVQNVMGLTQGASFPLLLSLTMAGGGMVNKWSPNKPIIGVNVQHTGKDNFREVMSAATINHGFKNIPYTSVEIAQLINEDMSNAYAYNVTIDATDSNLRLGDWAGYNKNAVCQFEVQTSVEDGSVITPGSTTTISIPDNRNFSNQGCTLKCFQGLLGNYTSLRFCIYFVKGTAESTQGVTYQHIDLGAVSNGAITNKSITFPTTTGTDWTMLCCATRRGSNYAGSEPVLVLPNGLKKITIGSALPDISISITTKNLTVSSSTLTRIWAQFTLTNNTNASKQVVPFVCYRTPVGSGATAVGNSNIVFCCQKGSLISWYNGGTGLSSSSPLFPYSTTAALKTIAANGSITWSNAAAAARSIAWSTAQNYCLGFGYFTSDSEGVFFTDLGVKTTAQGTNWRTFAAIYAQQSS